MNGARLAGFVTCALALAGPARATTSEVDVPAECGSAAQFDSEVAARLGEKKPLLATQLRIQQADGGFELDMRVGSEARTLHDTDCRALFRSAVVVAVAMSLSQSERRPAPAPLAAPNLIRTEPGAPPEPAKPVPEHWFGVAALGGMNIGELPRPALELGLEGSLGLRKLSVGASLHYLAPASAQDANQRGVRVYGLGGNLWLSFPTQALVELAAGFSVTRLSGTGLGAPSQASDSAWTAGPNIGLSLIPLRRSGTFIGVGAALQLHLLRPEFQILNYGSVFQVPVFSGDLLFRIGHDFF
ncbi:MAG: hypothetical protein QM756_46000 [Polyangiaceae bacterium]